MAFLLQQLLADLLPKAFRVGVLTLSAGKAPAFTLSAPYWTVIPVAFVNCAGVIFFCMRRL
jgi:hypothetical protein